MPWLPAREHAISPSRLLFIPLFTQVSARRATPSSRFSWNMVGMYSVPPALGGRGRVRHPPGGLLHRLRNGPHAHARHAPQAADRHDLVPPGQHGDELRSRRVPFDGPLRLRGRRDLRRAQLRRGFSDNFLDAELLSKWVFCLCVAKSQCKQRQSLLCKWRHHAVRFRWRCGRQRRMPVQERHRRAHRGQRYCEFLCMLDFRCATAFLKSRP